MALSTTFTQCAQETTKVDKITQNKGHFAVQGHSRSPLLKPIESTYLLSCTVSEIQHAKCQPEPTPITLSS